MYSTRHIIVLDVVLQSYGLYFYDVFCIFVLLGIMVSFTQSTFMGMESAAFVMVGLQLEGGTSASPFSVTVTPSEQSPMSAEGNSVMCVLLCVD